ncbi:hydantoinase B/oxoprolinase family protein [Sphingosinicella microcystinivorans]|uniref:hydantoinase B/oxoprolinase family protein n=1 Tax=Sphingosinicella microcystinivorans TaxID=335406 RepID=UPI0022F3FF2A|nr:hydantoinase B/oxoprolinase family protein [Sphingosinicella microcystinivorans]WBX84168.1 hydantoinase B/oxoprolinase family protein [Sphingosinicella microcystinivorans]
MKAAGTIGETLVDPITIEVIGNAYTSIVEEMGEILVHASHSTNIKERRDCSTALLDPAGEIICQAEHIPMHLGSFLSIVPRILDHYAVSDIAPGDVFIANDPYEGGATHLPDIVIVEPVFAEGRLVAWAANTGHHADFVDRGNAHIYQEGLRIPPTRYMRAGAAQVDIERLILLNCQVPQERRHDLQAQIGANRFATERIIGLCARYGVETILAASAALIDYAERRMRMGIAEIPDGEYAFRDVLETAEIEDILDVSVNIVVSGDEMRFHFESPPQIRASLNVTYEALLASVFYAAKTIVDPEVPSNSGMMRPITVTAPPGTMFNCRHPAAVNGRLQPCQRIVDLVYGALAQAVPEQVVAAGNGACASVTFVGTSPTGELWVYLEAIGGGSGARATKNGLDGVHVHMTNTSNLPIEALEAEYPITVERYAFIEGSGGAGRHHGGRGLSRVFRAEADCRVRVGGSRLRSVPWGLDGGLPGASGAIIPGAGVELLNRTSGILRAGQTLEVNSPGAGGYGKPEAPEANA